MFGRILAACLLLLAWPTTIMAHQGPGPHGGPTTDAPPYYFELVLKEDKLEVFIFDEKENTPIAIKGAKGRATVLVGEDKETIALEPGTAEDGNLMVGKVGVKAGAGSRIVVVIEFPGKPAAVARFAI